MKFGRRLDEALIPYEREIKRFESLATAIVMVAPFSDCSVPLGHD